MGKGSVLSIGTSSGSVLSFSKVSTMAWRAESAESATAVRGHFLGLLKQALIKPKKVSSADMTMFVSLFAVLGLTLRITRQYEGETHPTLW